MIIGESPPHAKRHGYRVYNVGSPQGALMIEMTKAERVRAALAGEPVDRVPFSLWYHFGQHFREGVFHADMEHAFFERYDLDFIKVMNDYDYPRPDKLYDIREPEDWHRLNAVSPWNYDGYKQELVALRELSRKLADSALYIDTIFSPWTTARNICFKHWREHMEEYPDDFLAGLDTITTNLERLVAAMLEVGTSGIFLTISGASDKYLTAEEYERFGKPFDLRVLRAAEGAPFNVLHVHGSNVRLEQVLDYPVSCINWADRDETNPSLAQARGMTDLALMGGVEHLSFKETYLGDVESQVKDAIEQTGGHKFILTPGCSVKTNTYVRQIDNLREAVHKWGRMGSESA